MCKSKFHLVLLALFSVVFCTSIEALEMKYSPTTLQDYLEVVKKNNANIEISALNVQIAQANKESDALYRLAPNLTYSRGAIMNQLPYSGYNTPASNTYGVNFTLEGYGKRSARETLGQSKIERSAIELEKTKATVELYAINAYIDALRYSLTLKSCKDVLSKLNRYQGSPQAANAQGFLARYIVQIEQALAFSSLSMRNYSGNALRDLPLPTGNLNYPTQKLNFDELIAQAQSQRIEVLILQSDIDVADKNINLTMKNRNINIYPYISQTRTPAYTYSNGISYQVASANYGSASVTGGTANYAAQNSLNVGVTIPIPITNYLQSADIVNASSQKLQYELQLRDLKAQIETQVAQASIQLSQAMDKLKEAQKSYDEAVKSPSQDSVNGIMDIRDKEGILLEAKANYLKQLVNLWRQSGNYSVPLI
jgi:outer membrane protein TolC